MVKTKKTSTKELLKWVKEMYMTVSWGVTFSSSRNLYLSEFRWIKNKKVNTHKYIPNSSPLIRTYNLYRADNNLILQEKKNHR